MRTKSLAVVCVGYLALAGCALAAPWNDAKPGEGWMGIETTDGDTTFMLACRIPTTDGPAETYEIRIKTPQAPSPSQTLQISRLRETLATTVAWTTQTNGYFLSPMNEDEAALVFSAIRQSGGIDVESDGWIDIEVGVAEGDVPRLDAFMAQCKG